jgi:hypothetical protein
MNWRKQNNNKSNILNRKYKSRTNILENFDQLGYTLYNNDK